MYEGGSINKLQNSAILLIFKLETVSIADLLQNRQYVQTP